MQPDRKEVSTTSSSPNTPFSTSTSQHGIHRISSSASPRSLSREREDGGDQSVDDDADGKRRESYAYADTDVESEGDSPLKSPSSGDYSKLPTKSSPIGILPNELLTHALSHLPANDLSSVALVSQRFHALVTTPHAWRAAFARFFPGTTIEAAPKTESFRTDKRAFCRLTALATWRSEYIIRTHLLRSLSRGKPMQTGSSSSTPRGTGSNASANAIMMYNSQLYTTVNHIDATFGSGPIKRFPRFIHGADDTGNASASDPITGRIDNWGLSDPQFFLNFSEQFPGDAMWGLGSGDIIGLPNPMGVSQAYGMIYGEGSPSGGTYFRSVDEMRGKFLIGSTGISEPEVGIPAVDRTQEAVSAVWLAKSHAIPSLTEGLVGMLSGSSLGVLSAYSLGSHDLRDVRLARGDLTARWVLSPGVPIIAISVDESHSLKRQAQNRIWAVALNALGEVFYLTKFPKRSPPPRGVKLDEMGIERLAWVTARTVQWNLVELSRRAARPDPYGELDVEGSYSPRSSWNGMCLGKEQIKAESQEIEKFLRKRPKEFRQLCLGWDMERKLEVDFAGDDGNFAGESLMVFECGLQEESTSSIKRFTRLKVPEEGDTIATDTSADIVTPMVDSGSVFGRSTTAPTMTDSARGRRQSTMSYTSVDASPERVPTIEEWRRSDLTLGGSKMVQISTTTIDSSLYAMVTLSEDPAVGMLGSSEASSMYGSPLHMEDRSISAADIPGQRGRFVAAGTKTGTVYIWDCRAPNAKSVELVNNIEPISVIYTDSPEISCLGMTALHIVHGGNDGLVQAWDPLASETEPIRTLNSRFSSKARRRLVQAQASAQGVGINLFAAGAICLDPDPTVLRGMVSLGTHLRYWSYSSLTADQYKGTKRRLRRSERGSNQHTGERFAGAVRNSNLKSYIMNERVELEQEKLRQRRERERLAGRFGLGFLGNEEEALAYAAMLSEETLAQDKQRRASQANTPIMGSFDATQFPSTPPLIPEEEIDADMAAAIRLSLEGDRFDSPLHHSPGLVTSPGGRQYDVPIRITRKGRRASKTPSRSPPVRTSSAMAGSSQQTELDDLEFALQVSLAEERSRQEAFGLDNEQEEFPALGGTVSPKGKGKARQ
ncbi:hypothetical protein BLS_004720 [Venturia inaequalis]|uniref:F-box domain-containing protein n=1 Tax=Venturia inaequalis TaxID=5025 RepID=A0A8H3UK33_VENIN|nr:hypothetical protein BLS_004720 [Venturia inaequalis]RDI76910.1 Meiotically up-regulated 157 protein [Venturia inaequalis]